MNEMFLTSSHVFCQVDEKAGHCQKLYRTTFLLLKYFLTESPIIGTQHVLNTLSSREKEHEESIFSIIEELLPKYSSRIKPDIRREMIGRGDA